MRSATDARSEDQWARLAGWYVATIEGKRHDFSNLGDALRAYDAATVRKRGLLVREAELNLPEEWSGLFADEEEEEKGPPTHMKDNLNPSKTTIVRITKPTKESSLGLHIQEEPYGRGVRVMRIDPRGPCHGTALRAGAVIGSIISSINGVACATSEEAVTLFRAAGRALTIAVTMPGALADWTNHEIITLITLDEKYTSPTSHCTPQIKYARMAAGLPGRSVDQCRNKVYELRTKARGGRDILGSMLNLEDIKTTLAKWTKEEIDLLMTLEQQFQGQDEESQNASIAQALPRWGRDRCSFKTVYMRWYAMVQEFAHKRKRKAKPNTNAEPKKRKMSAFDVKREAEAHAKRIAAGKASRATQERAAPFRQEDGRDQDEPAANIGGSTQLPAAAPSSPHPPPTTDASPQTPCKATPKTNFLTRHGDIAGKAMALATAARGEPGATAAVASGGMGAPSPPKTSKIDANFAEMLSNDPYLQNQGDSSTLEDLVT